jgi:hypothetical protein
MGSRLLGARSAPVSPHARAATATIDGMTEPPVATRPGGGTSPAGQVPPATPGAAPGGRWQTWRTQAAVLLRQHWLVTALVAAGLVLRVLTLAAYQPALIYVDSLKYLYGVYPGSDPLGYRWLLKVILAVGNLGTVAAIQHLLGLAMAVVLYVVLLRRGVRIWLAALAVAPVLLDAYQLQMEQMIMPDVWFEAMIVAALAVLLWRPAASVPFAVAAGLILGSSATIRAAGEILVLPAVLYLLAAGGGWRRALARSVSLAAAFAVPILLYCGISYVRTGHFWLSHSQTSIGRMAAAADCATLKLPAAVRPMCPGPAVQAKGPDWLEHSGQSPLYTTPVPPGTTRTRMLATLGSAIRGQQPLRVAGAIAGDSLRLFALTRDGIPSVTPISRWQFQASYPTFPQWITVDRAHYVVVGIQRSAFGKFRFSRLNPSYGGKAQVNRPVAGFLRAYQLGGGYTPGPLFALFTLAGLAGSLVAVIRRRAGGARSLRLAAASLLFTATALVLLLVPDVLEFSWRYELPAVIILPPAGVLGIAALLSRRRAATKPAATG